MNYQPDQLGGFRVGDVIDVPNLGRCLVDGLVWPSMLEVKTQSGALVKVGYLAATKAF